VCVHTQLDVRDRITVPSEGGSLETLALVPVTDPADLAALALARRLGGAGATLTAVAAAPPSGERALREALANGAHGAIRVWADGLDESALGARGVVDLLAPVLDGLAPDVIVCGSRGLAAGYGYVGPALADRLGYGQVAEVTGVTGPGASEIVVERRLTRGRRELVAADLPVLMTVGAGAVELDVPPLRDAVAAEQAAIEVVEAPRRLATVNDQASGRVAGVQPPRPRTKKTAAASLSAKDRMRAMVGGGAGGAGRAKKKGVVEGPAQAVATEIVDFLATNNLIKAR
jgi:electron transfer flavoprotein beta subunit